MSIRFSLSYDHEIRAKQIKWLEDHAGMHFVGLRIDGHYVDFVHDEDAAMFKMAFETKRKPTRLETMIEREEILERIGKMPGAWGNP